MCTPDSCSNTHTHTHTQCKKCLNLTNNHIIMHVFMCSSVYEHQLTSDTNKSDTEHKTSAYKTTPSVCVCVCPSPCAPRTTPDLGGVVVMVTRRRPAQIAAGLSRRLKTESGSGTYRGWLLQNRKPHQYRLSLTVKPVEVLSTARQAGGQAGRQAGGRQAGRQPSQRAGNSFRGRVITLLDSKDSPPE